MPRFRNATQRLSCAGPSRSISPGRKTSPSMNTRTMRTSLRFATLPPASSARNSRNSVPAHIARVITPKPYAAFVKTARALFEDDLRPLSIVGTRGVDPEASVHEEARLEDGVIVDPGAVIGPDAEIGAGTIICANVVIGPNVRIGRDCSDRAGREHHACFARRPRHHPCRCADRTGRLRVHTRQRPCEGSAAGRVIVQDDVEIGAGTTRRSRRRTRHGDRRGHQDR